MLRSTVGSVLLVLAALVVVNSSARAGKKPPPVEKVKETEAVKWDWTIYDENDKKIEQGFFVVRGFAIYNGNGKRIGSYEDVDKGRTVKVEITEGRLKGTLNLTKEENSEGNWKGEIDSDRKGGKYKVSLVFEKVKEKVIKERGR